MKWKLVGMCLCTALAASAVRADAISELVTVDENGNGSVTTPNGTTPLVGTLGRDPTSSSNTGGFSLVLAYPLPFLAIPGDVVLTEPGTSEPVDSDLIRFIFNPQSSSMNPTSLLLFYSDLPGPGEVADLADVGVPPPFTLPSAPIVRQEVGPEAGPNGVTYTPGVTGGFVDPGNIDTSGGVSYNIVSDTAGVPLPASVWAGTALLTGLGAWRVIRKRAAI